MKASKRYMLLGLFGSILIYWNIIGYLQTSFVNEIIVPAINEFFTLREYETKDKFINLHQYNFSLNINICYERKIFLLIVVHSAPTNIEKRTNIRTTYGSVHSHKGRELAVVFMLGSVDDQGLQQSLNNESKTFGDIVQGNFHDSYKNLTKKHVMGMHWYVHYCSSDFILKVDDDSFINPFRMLDSLTNQPTNEMMLHCHIISDDSPTRKPWSKYYTSSNQYPFPFLPPFCVGFAYITTPKAWKALYRASEDRRMMDMDDVFVSIVLSYKANVGKVGFQNVFFCERKDNVWAIEELNKSILVIDRFNKCGDEPFKIWKLLSKE